MYYDGFHRSFCDDDDDLDIIQESDSIFAFETPETFKLENIRTKRGNPHFSQDVCTHINPHTHKVNQQDLSFYFAGSLLANLNHNNLKYGTEISRTPSFMQGAMTPVTASPNKNQGPEKIILLVCNRACTGHQGKRYCSCSLTVLSCNAALSSVNNELIHHLCRSKPG